MTINYKYIGWCSVDNSDKVWACIQLSGGEWYNKKFLTVWGRRGKRLQSKLIETSVAEMDRLIRSKDAKGYVEIPEDKLNQVYPEFKQDLEKTAAWSMLMA
jgi:predicted DNA-binding WGR domain protein